MDRAALVDRLRTSGLDPSPWSNGPGDTYAAHHHGYDKVLVVASGSIEFMTPGGTVALVAGDRLDLPAGTDHAAVVGTEGVTCLESHLPAGSLAGLRRTGDGAW